MNPGKPMATAAEPEADLRYTLESLKTIEVVKERAGQILRERAKERALSQHRDRITTDDVLNSIADSLRQTIDEARRAASGA
jgi:hypothetical protein